MGASWVQSYQLFEVINVSRGSGQKDQAIGPRGISRRTSDKLEGLGDGFLVVGHFGGLLGAIDWATGVFWVVAGEG
jgi:hypothetical protein